MVHKNNLQGFFNTDSGRPSRVEIEKTATDHNIKIGFMDFYGRLSGSMLGVRNYYLKFSNFPIVETMASITASAIINNGTKF